MPTGYTAKLSQGEQSFHEFILTCARAFGACVMQREDSMDILPQIPKREIYHQQQAASARDRIDMLAKLSYDGAMQHAAAQHANAMRDWATHNETRSQENSRFLGMMEQVRAWEPPTSDHAELKKFMLDQLELSVNNYDYPAPVLQDPRRWLADELAETGRSLAYHTKAQDEANARHASRVKWIEALYASLSAK